MIPLIGVVDGEADRGIGHLGIDGQRPLELLPGFLEGILLVEADPEVVVGHGEARANLLCISGGGHRLEGFDDGAPVGGG